MSRTYPATVLHVTDGDSVRVAADLGFDVWRNVSVRLAGINAAELATPGGKAAHAHLTGLLPLGTPVTLLSISYDKYGGRIDGQLILPSGRSVAAAMVADGYAALWDGRGVRPIPPWPLPA